MESQNKKITLDQQLWSKVQYHDIKQTQSKINNTVFSSKLLSIITVPLALLFYFTRFTNLAVISIIPLIILDLFYRAPPKILSLIEEIDLLIAQGADVNANIYFGNHKSILSTAALVGDIVLVRHLIEKHGAIINDTRNGSTALLGCLDLIAPSKENINIAELLLEKGALLPRTFTSRNYMSYPSPLFQKLYNNFLKLAPITDCPVFENMIIGHL